MKTITSIVEQHACTGCFGCTEVCPTECIDVKEDSEGFPYPSVRTGECIECGKCLLSCHAAHPSQLHTSIDSRVLRSEDPAEYQLGASGGAFGSMCQVQMKKGFIAYGAAFDDHYKLIHARATEYDECLSLFGSKYIQSDTRSAFSSILQDLKDGKSVLFCGTPCQVSALLKLLKGGHDNLWSVDLICHGVPSPGFWRTHLDYLKEKCGPVFENLRFRFKTRFDKAGYALNIWTPDRHWVIPHEEDVYYTAFLRGLSLRECCYRCKYARPERVGDLTIGDCGTLEDYKAFDKTGLGTVVLVNTEKGEKLLRELEPFILSDKLDLAREVASNAQLQHPTLRPAIRDSFYHDLHTLNYSQFTKKYLEQPSAFGAVKRRVKRRIPWTVLESCKRVMRRMKW